MTAQGDRILYCFAKGVIAIKTRWWFRREGEDSDLDLDTEAHKENIM